jgi:hypothetical protein
MAKMFAWLGVAMLVVVCGSRVANAGDPLKPYVVLVLDTSGSMVANDCGGGSGSCGNPTGSGPPSCGGIDNKLNHAKCAINNIVNAYGDMVFALGRFRTTQGGTTTTNTFPTGCCEAGPAISANNGCSAGPACNATTTGTGALLEMLTSLVDGGNQSAATFTNFTGGSCTAGGSDPEIWDGQGLCNGGGGADGSCGGATPLDGVLKGTKRYWTGQQATDGTVLWQQGLAGYDPIRTDPLRAQFIPPVGKLQCDPNPNTCQPLATCGTTNCCCVEQCRPYVVILLTDGAESCSGNPATGAAELFNTDLVVDSTTRRYRIETKPIGYGIAPGNAQIEAIAHAGGAADGVGNEGYYAVDEASLQLAISNILDDAIRTEVCNGGDDDCDSLIDEDFPNNGQVCNNGKKGVCLVNGAFECRVDGSATVCDAGVDACASIAVGGACTVANSAGVNKAGTCQIDGGVKRCLINTIAEICNSLDDDCDGKVDEDTMNCSCVPQGEQCNGMDDDCDGVIDDGIIKPCGGGVCQGTQTCVVGGTGVFGPCVDGNGDPVPQPPFPAETCNGDDDNCDGIIDGLNAACSTMNPLPPENMPVDAPENNPGHPSNTPHPANICRPGNKSCPINGNGTFGACQGEIKPCNNPSNNAPDSCADICDGRDEDCDNVVDEDFAPADCSSNCGIGTTQCMNGQIICNSVPVGTDNTCNNIDDDCDGNIDEGYVPPGGACGVGVVCDGALVCQNGVEVCVGDPIGQESCNCIDDNCNGEVDEGQLCGTGGAQCKFCQCALPCAEDEFPCPMGKFCKTETLPTCGGAGQPACNKFCVADPCFNITCPPVNGAKQVCQPTPLANDYTCVSACSLVQCSANEVCIPATGECKPDNCHTFPERCAANQLCVAGECVTNLCQGVTCGANQYCVQGECYGSCADVECPDGQRCRMGVCENDPCGKPCPFGQVCIESSGECKTDECQMIPCPIGQYCNPQTVACENDPCNGTTCPGTGQVCKGGTCFDENDLKPDAPEEVRVTTGGGGGCRTSGDGSFVLALLALGLLWRRRSAGGRS